MLCRKTILTEHSSIPARLRYTFNGHDSRAKNAQYSVQAIQLRCNAQQQTTNPKHQQLTITVCTDTNHHSPHNHKQKCVLVHSAHSFRLAPAPCAYAQSRQARSLDFVSFGGHTQAHIRCVRSCAFFGRRIFSSAVSRFADLSSAIIVFSSVKCASSVSPYPAEFVDRLHCRITCCRFSHCM